MLAAIPEEVLARDYGCGDPTRHLRPGETVLDLGSGSGKACFLAAQVVGREGRVIGVDMNDEMLALARRHAPKVARRIGFANVTFRRPSASTATGSTRSCARGPSAPTPISSAWRV